VVRRFVLVVLGAQGRNTAEFPSRRCAGVVAVTQKAPSCNRRTQRRLACLGAGDRAFGKRRNGSVLESTLSTARAAKRPRSKP
jgi:hypothetical protein